MKPEPTDCCPKFDPSLWEDRVITWEKKPFLQTRVRSFLHIPLNFGAVVRRSMAAIAAAGATSNESLILSDENSLWGADVYLPVSKEVPGARMTALSGTFLVKVFEGPYRNVPQWMAEMKSFVQSKGKAVRKLLIYYTTCPKCAKKHGKNYVLFLAGIDQ